MAKKPSTDDILNKIRKQGAAGSGGESAGSEPAAAPEPEASAPAEKPKAAPAGAGDLLAKIRAQGAAGSGGVGEAAEAEASAAKPAAKAAPGKPGGILAAIRAQGAAGSGGAAPAEAPSGAAAPAKKRAVVAAPAGDLPPVSEMLEQLKAGKKKEAVAVAAKPQLKVPVKPAAKAVAEPVSRRNVLLSLVATPFALAWTVMTVTAGVWLLGIARYMFPNVLVEPPSQFKIGSPSDYPSGTVSTKWAASRGIWIVHTDQYQGKDLIYALSTVCTHLGCTPSWLEGEQKFKCPCHGSGFYVTGINFEGPAPRPLERVGLSLASDGMLEVDKSVKFQEEKGQWEDAKSFVDASLV